MPSPPLSLVQSLSPRIAVLTSDDVVDSCTVNGCKGLEELLRPWESGAEMVQIMSSTLTPTKHPTFPLRFVSYSSIFPHPEISSPNPDIVVDQISSLVGSGSPESDLQYPVTRSMLLSSRPLAPHETFNHPVGMLLAISTSTPDPLGTLQRLQSRAMGPMSQVVPWMDGINVLRFYVVVHDVSKKGENLEEAYDLLAGVKKAYGPHSTLLVVNSLANPRPVDGMETKPHSTIPLPKSSTDPLPQTYAEAMSSLYLSPDFSPNSERDGNAPYGSRLSNEDAGRMVSLVKELVTQSLVPWMEARVREWNEVWHANRRGITGRLFGAGRKLFSSRPASPAPNSQGYNTVKGYYPITAIEALSRRLADFSFMLRDYKFASTVYDSLRRDFAQDRAWRYAAAATEMYGLSLLLSHAYFHPATPPNPPSAPFTSLQHTDISSWLEQAVLAYQGRAPANQIQLDALRITVLYYEAWKMIGEWRGVGLALVKAAGEADEVPSAVMIEEGAIADVRKGRGRRQRAFHLVLAARRYETTGLKPFSRRCLDRASEIYRTAPWSAAQEMIEYSLGRQAYTLGESEVAVEHFLRLLDGRQTGDQSGVLEDLALSYKQWHPTGTSNIQLPTPIFNVKKTRVIASSASTSRHAQLGQDLQATGRKIRIPTGLEASVGETLHVELIAKNPINATLALSDIKLELDPAIDITPFGEILLEPYESRIISFPFTPTDSGTFTVKSISFQFHKFFPCTQSLTKQGKRLHTTKAQRLTPTYATDTSLTIHVIENKPRFRATMQGIPDTMYLGEMAEGSIEIENTGTLSIDHLELFTNQPGSIWLRDEQAKLDKSAIPNTILPNKPLTLHQQSIAPGSTTSIPITFIAMTAGPLEILGLVLSGEESTPIEYDLDVLHLIEAQASSSRSRVQLNVANSAPEIVELQSISSSSAYWNIDAQDLSSSILPDQSYSTTLSVLPLSGSLPDVHQTELVSQLSDLVQGTPPDELPAKPIQSVSLSSLPPPAYLSSRRKYRLDFLQRNFPSLPPSTIHQIFPLFDPLDLDLLIHWSIPHTDRKGLTVIHGIRVAPAFSIIEGVRKEVDEAVAKGSKNTRTMYEETGRLRRLLMDSVLNGVYAQEDDPITLRIKIEGLKRGRISRGNGSIPIQFHLENRSPSLTARWRLDLPSSPVSSDLEINSVHFAGELNHRGTLSAGNLCMVNTAIWVSDEGLITLEGWDFMVETGELNGDDWTAIQSWSMSGRGPTIEVTR